jgi:hypothetical protein
MLGIFHRRKMALREMVLQLLDSHFEDVKSRQLIDQERLAYILLALGPRISSLEGPLVVGVQSRRTAHASHENIFADPQHKTEADLQASSV